MNAHVAAASAGNFSSFGWILGYVLGGIVVLAVVALVVPILLLARSIGDEAVHNTAPLAALRTTIEHATIIIGGLQRGRERLGG
jgi:hypothetical protein